MCIIWKLLPEIHWVDTNNTSNEWSCSSWAAGSVMFSNFYSVTVQQLFKVTCTLTCTVDCTMVICLVLFCISCNNGRFKHCPKYFVVEKMMGEGGDSVCLNPRCIDNGLIPCWSYTYLYILILSCLSQTACLMHMSTQCFVEIWEVCTSDANWFV